jgi:MFS family permease
MPEFEQVRPGKVPRWYRITWFLGRAPDLSERQWLILGLVAGVSFFEQYDLYLFSLNLSHIQAELNIAEGNLGFLGSIVRAGALLSILITLAADRWGRRKMLLVTVLCYTLLTGATAFSPNVEIFVVLQFFARAFAVAEVLIAAVVIAEEFPPQHRGWGIGALGAIQACGAGLAALLFSLVDVLPYGWRSLYLIGLVPLILLTYWRRHLPETELFVSVQQIGIRQPRRASLMSPITALLRHSPRMLLSICIVLFFLAMTASAAGFFAPKYLQDSHGWSPAAVAIMMAVGGAFGIIGNPLAGWLSDRFGRRPTSIGFSLAFLLVASVFYGSLGVFVPFLWIGLIFFMMGTEVTVTAYGTELFPTRMRSTAAGVRGVVATIGAVMGLAAVSLLFVLVGSNWLAIMILCGIGIIVPLLFYLLFPETAGRKLQELAPDGN